MPNPNPIQDLLTTALSNAASEEAEVEEALAEGDETEEETETEVEESASEEETEESTESDDEEAAEASETDEDESEDADSSKAATKKPEKADKDDPFADLKTPKGIKKAREAIETQRAEVEKRQAGLDRGYATLKKAEKEHKTEKKKFQAQMEPVNQLIGKIRETWKVVRTSPSVKQRFFALGEILGYDGQRAYEELSLEIANDGQSPQPSAAERAYEERIRALEERIARGAEQQTKAQKEAEAKNFIARRTAEIRTAAEDAQTYPTIAAQVEAEAVTYDDVVDWVKRAMKEHFDGTGTKLDEADALASLEESLTKARGKAQAKPVGSGVPPKPATSSQASPKPGQRKIGRTVTTTAATVGRRRELSEDERLDLLSRDKDLVHSIFGGHANPR
jgi:hypothetical protein